jgi:hypothetical protein
MEQAKSIWEIISAIVRFGADLVTLSVGLAALWALVFHRRKISLIVKMFVNSYLNERIKRTKETLGRLESLTFDNKEHRPEIIALLGQLCGQIKTIAPAHTEVSQTYKELRELLDNKLKLTEATKRRIIYEVHSGLDNAYSVEIIDILENQQ